MKKAAKPQESFSLTWTTKSDVDESVIERARKKLIEIGAQGHYVFALICKQEIPILRGGAIDCVTLPDDYDASGEDSIIMMFKNPDASYTKTCLTRTDGTIQEVKTKIAIRQLVAITEKLRSVKELPAVEIEQLEKSLLLPLFVSELCFVRLFPLMTVEEARSNFEEMSSYGISLGYEMPGWSAFRKKYFEDVSGNCIRLKTEAILEIADMIEKDLCLDYCAERIMQWAKQVGGEIKNVQESIEKIKEEMSTASSAVSEAEEKIKNLMASLAAAREELLKEKEKAASLSQELKISSTFEEVAVALQESSELALLLSM